MTKEELQKIPEMAKRIAKHEERLYYLQEKATCVPAIETQEKVQTSVINHGNREADMAIDLSRKIDAEREELEDMQREAEAFFRRFPFREDEETVLRCRYLYCMTWKKIAEDMHFTERHIFRIYGGAMDTMFGGKKKK